MGKRLQIRFPDVNQRIIKRIRKDKPKSERVVSKRKRKSSTDLIEPKEKISKNELGSKIHHSCLSIERKNEFNNDNVYVGKLPKSKDIVLKHKEVGLDLLFSDELKNSYLNLINADLYFIILDEISLEGLDGITIEAFWKRLLFTLEKFPCVIQSIKNFIWQNVIACNAHFKFYELPVPRKELEIYNRFDYMNTDIGVVMELAYELPDIYPPKPVNDTNVLGSCSTFNERVDISNDVIDLTIDQAEDKYGLGLVIVAEQNLRTYAICGDLIDPLIAFLNTEYCVLERVGRSRKLGELTQGQMSIASAFNMDPKSVFHYKKALYNNELISKQFFYIKSPLHEQNKTGSLLQLRRFYTNIRSYQSYMASEIINILKRQPGYRIESRKLREICSETFSTIGKLLKNQEFRKLVKLKLYPYKTVYPNATRAECTNKNKTEKNASCYELLNPYVNVAAYWRDDRDESDDEDDEKEEEQQLSGQMIYNMNTIRNVYYRILLSGDDGCTAKDIRHLTGFDVNTTRTGLRKLNQKGVVNLRKIDIGKIRKYRYTVSVKKPDEPSTSNMSCTTIDKPKQSSVKARIIEKQKVALAKKKMENLNKSKPVETIDNFLEIEIPIDTSYTFLIRDFSLGSSSNIIYSFPLERGDIRLPKNYAINLTFLNIDSNRLFDINKILDEINPKLKIISALPNFENFYVSKYSNECIETTLLLLKATLGKVEIAKEFPEVESKPKSETAALPDLTKIGSAVLSRSTKLDYMGEHPVVDYYENENNITVEITASTMPEKFRFEKVYEKSNQTITERVYNRIQIVLDLVNDMKIIEEMMKVNKLVADKEIENGYNKKLDRKSLFRIIKKLVDEGYIKVYKLAVYNNAINKTVVFICHPSVNHMDDTIKSACQQIKWKFFTSCTTKSSRLHHVPGVQKRLENKIGKSPFSQTDVLKSINEMNNLNRMMVKEIHRKHRKTMGVIYGHKAKFTRMRIMHEFLFYLVYNYNGFQNPLPREDVRKLFKSYRIELSDKDLNEIPNVYCNEISWKMFVPPLPAHAGWPTGWALVCDIILRFPLSVLLKIHNCCYEDSELLATLNHPVKRFYLVKDQSEIIRRTIFFKRKYLYDAYDTINRLVFCGLVQFGPKKYKDKDQLFIYLNRRASLKDTRSSGPGYNEVENKEYPELPFYFNNLTDIEHYWRKLNSISLNTKLNNREHGKIVTLTYINTKVEFMECVKSRTPKEALLHDNGLIPGDGKGACGLDSSLWPHLVRNWVWSTKGNRSYVFTGLTNETLKEIPPQNILFNDLCANVIPKFYLPFLPKTGQFRKTLTAKEKRVGSRNAKYTRIIQRKVKKHAKREYNDELDRKIIKKLGTRRAKWAEQEEEPTLLCKIGDLILNVTKYYKKQIIPFTVVRDVLHRICPMSKYKTSRAIQRHWVKMQKRSSSYVGLENKVLNLFKLKPMAETFKILLDKIGVPDETTKVPFKMSEAQKSAAYVILMSYLDRNRKRIFDVLEGNLVNSDHLSEDNLKYTEETAVEVEKKEKKYVDPKNEIDIKKDIVKSVIHSSLCSKKITEFSAQLFKIYQNYPDALVREAVKELRENNLICYRTKRQRGTKIWDTPFCLSQFYIFFQCSTFSNVTAEEAFRVLRNVTTKSQVNFDMDVTALHNSRYGQLLGLNEFFTFYPDFELSFYLPQNTIVLNPDIADHDELVKELAVRYQLKLKMLLEIDFETEGDTDRSKTQDQELISLEVDKEVSESYEQSTTVPTDSQDIPMDLTADGNNAETINRLKTWITDCMTAESERRSPSPEFMIKHSELHRNEAECQENIRTDDDNDECGVGLRGYTSTEKNLGHIPTLDEIKEGMLKTNIKDEERTIPHITELSDLLAKSFYDLKMDSNTLQRLKSHFITEYVKLDHIIMNELDNLQDHYMVQYIDASMRNEKMWDKIENDVTVKDFLTLPNFEELIRNDDGKDEDIALATEIIQFAAGKGILGATAQELKEIFLPQEKNCSLTSIIKHLIESGLLLQMGVVTLTFVHYKYQHAWVVEQVFGGSDAQSTSDSMELDQGSPLSVGMKLKPWVGVNGLLDKTVLKNWITNVLSYTLDYPNVTFGRMCDKYCYIKPVDLFYIVQILEELGCVELSIYELRQDEDLFTNWVKPERRYASFLDNLEDIVIQPNNASMTCLGSFFCKLLDA